MERRTAHIISRIAGLLAVLTMGLLVAVQTPGVQTFISKRVINSLNRTICGDLSFSKLKILAPNTVILSDFLVKDKAPFKEEGGRPVADTVFYARTVTATLTLKGLASQEEIHIGRAMVEDGYMHLTIEKTEQYKNNLNRVLGGGNKDKKANKGNIFDIRRARIKNFRFKMTNYTIYNFHRTKDGIDFRNLDARADVKAHGIRFSGGKMRGTADRIKLEEKSGMKVERLSGWCEAGNGKTTVKNLRLVDRESDIRFKYYTMYYGDQSGLAEYISRTLMELEFDSGVLGMSTITAICGCHSGEGARLDIKKGHAKGYVNDIAFDNIRFKDLDSGVSGTVDGRITGLPDVNHTILNARASNVRFTLPQMQRFASRWAPGAHFDISGLAPGKKMRADASTSGFINRMNISGLIQSDKSFGKAKVRIAFNHLVDRTARREMSMVMDTDDLDLGQVTGKEGLGPADAHFSGSMRMGKGSRDFTVDSLHIGHVLLGGHDYRDITAFCSLRRGNGELNLEIKDPALDCSFQGILSSGIDDIKDYSLVGVINNAEPYALGINMSEGVGVSGNLELSLSRNNKAENLDGNISITGFQYRENGVLNKLEDLTAGLKINGPLMNLELDSPFAKIGYTGSKSINGLIKDIENVTIRRELAALWNSGSKKPVYRKAECRLEADFRDVNDLLQIVKPGLFIADSSHLSLNLSEKGTLIGKMNSGRLAYGDTYIKDADISVDNEYRLFRAVVKGSEFKSGNIRMDKPFLNARAAENSVSVDIECTGLQDQKGISELHLGGKLDRDAAGDLKMSLTPAGSFLNLYGETLKFKDSEIRIESKKLIFDNFLAGNENRFISLDGNLSRNSEGLLKLKLKNIDLSHASSFFGKKADTFAGLVQCTAEIHSPVSSALKAGITMECDSLSMSGSPIGSIRFNGNWDKKSEKMDLGFTQTRDGRTAINATGSYATKTGQISLDLAMDNFDISPLGPFVTNTFSELGGGLSGDIIIEGPADNPSVDSRGLTLDNVKIRLAYTGAPYIINGPVRINGDGLHFESLKIRDDGNGTGTLKGSLFYRGPKDISADAILDFHNMKAVSNNGTKDESVYGLAYISGKAVISGPVNALKVDVDVRTEGDGNIHIPINRASQSSQSDLLAFTSGEKTEDPYDAVALSLQKKKASRSNICIKARTHISPGLNAIAEFNRNSGMFASFRGNGVAEIEINPAQDIFKINGDYIINSGEFHFVVPGLLAKDFDISNGSSVNFGGSIQESTIDLTATHTLRTSLTNILSDTTAISSRRVVNCIISVTDKLKDPKMNFNIVVPDLDPTTKSQLESAINTRDKLETQFFSLLLIGTFIPSEQTGIVDRNNILLSNFSKVMSNQINNVLQKLDVPLNLGFEYSQNRSGKDNFGVNASTTLLDDRMTLTGSMGNKRYNNSTSKTGDIVGDIDAEYKLGKQGNFRIHLFSHSADEYSSYLDLSQRFGGGITYQKEFHSIGQLIKNIFSPKKEKQPDNTVTISITE